MTHFFFAFFIVLIGMILLNFKLSPNENKSPKAENPVTAEKK